MTFIFHLLLGLAIAAAGAFMVIRTSIVIDFFGAVEWAEAKLGGGGTNLFYKCVGLFVVFIGFLVATNLWEKFLFGAFSSFMPGLGR